MVLSPLIGALIDGVGFGVVCVSVAALSLCAVPVIRAMVK
jgi:hypothetical protein